jgi:hypothetical protein
MLGIWKKAREGVLINNRVFVIRTCFDSMVLKTNMVSRTACNWILEAERNGYSFREPKALHSIFKMGRQQCVQD